MASGSVDHVVVSMVNAVMWLLRHLRQRAYPATFCQNVRQPYATTHFHFINTNDIINEAPLHGRIVTVGLCEFPNLLIIASNNMIPHLISVWNIDSSWKFWNISYARLFWLDTASIVLHRWVRLSSCTAVKRQPRSRHRNFAYLASPQCTRVLRGKNFSQARRYTLFLNKND